MITHSRPTSSTTLSIFFCDTDTWHATCDRWHKTCLYWFFYPYTSGDSVSPICGICLFIAHPGLNKTFMFIFCNITHHHLHTIFDKWPKWYRIKPLCEYSPKPISNDGVHSLCGSTCRSITELFLHYTTMSLPFTKLLQHCHITIIVAKTQFSYMAYPFV